MGLPNLERAGLPNLERAASSTDAWATGACAAATDSVWLEDEPSPRNAAEGLANLEGTASESSAGMLKAAVSVSVSSRPSSMTGGSGGGACKSAVCGREGHSLGSW